MGIMKTKEECLLRNNVMEIDLGYMGALAENVKAAMALYAAQIAKGMAIRFAQFVEENRVDWDEGKQKMILNDEMCSEKTFEELFNMFVSHNQP